MARERRASGSVQPARGLRREQRWWASKLKRELAAPAIAAKPTTPEVRIARVIRTESAGVASALPPPSHAITLELAQTGVRIGVEPGADHATLAMILDVLGVAR